MTFFDKKNFENFLNFAMHVSGEKNECTEISIFQYETLFEFLRIANTEKLPEMKSLHDIFR